MRRLAGALLGLLALAGCETAGVATPVAIAAGDLVVTPPEGYCADPVSSRLQAGFAVFASCISLGTQAPVPRVIGVATIQAGAPQSAMVAGSETGLRDFLATPQGAALLSASGDAGTVTVQSAQVIDRAVIVAFSDTAPAPLAGLGRQEWRGFTDVGNRLVTVSVRALENAPLTSGGGVALLNRFLTNIVDAGPAANPQQQGDTPS